MEGNGIYIALDGKTLAESLELVSKLHEYVDGFKVGFEFITSVFAKVVQTLDTEKEVDETYTYLKNLRQLFYLLKGKLFYDGKFNDIPNTVKNAVIALMPISPKFFNVHASSGTIALKDAVANRGTSEVLAVTVLTSILEECNSIFGEEPGEKVLHFVQMALNAGVQGIVCSAKELEFLKQYKEFKKLKFITPGVRSPGADSNDQARIDTPKNAIKNGAYGLVIGRQVTTAKDPVAAVKQIIGEIEEAKAEMKAERSHRLLQIFSTMSAIVKDSHLVYTSGKHGDEYVDKNKLYLDPVAVSNLCYEIALEFVHDDIQIVCGPEKGGICLSQFVAYHLSFLTGHIVESIFSEKEGEAFAVNRGWGENIKGKRMLIVEDVLTTGGSVLKTIEEVKKHDPSEIVGVSALCNRGGVTAEILGVTRLMSLVSVSLKTYEAAECPLCKEKVPVNTQLGHGKTFLESDAGKAIYG